MRMKLIPWEANSRIYENYWHFPFLLEKSTPIPASSRTLHRFVQTATEYFRFKFPRSHSDRCFQNLNVPKLDASDRICQCMSDICQCDNPKYELQKSSLSLNAFYQKVTCTEMTPRVYSEEEPGEGATSLFIKRVRLPSFNLFFHPSKISVAVIRVK